MKSTKCLGAAIIVLGAIRWSPAEAETEEPGAKPPQRVVSFEETEGAPKISREAALRLARAYTGLSEKVPVRARYGRATDPLIPFFEVVQRPAWEVVFEGVKIATTQTDGSQKRNPYINTITVLLDAESGALLKVSSPPPDAPNEKADHFSFEDYGKLESTPAKPPIPFMQTLQYTGFLKTETPNAKQVVAFFGLLTDERDQLAGPIKDRPYWIIGLGGLKVVMPGGPPGGPGTPPGTKMTVLLDAETGEPRFVSIRNPGRKHVQD